MISIYKITNQLNDKLYVGQTNQALEKRLCQHSKAKTALGDAIRECGLGNFTIEKIEECETRPQANDRERFWVKELKCKAPKGYNQTDGGEHSICERSNVVNFNPPPPKKSALDLLAEENNLSAEDKAFLKSFLNLSPTSRAIIREIGSAFAIRDMFQSMMAKVATEVGASAQ